MESVIPLKVNFVTSYPIMHARFKIIYDDGTMDFEKINICDISRFKMNNPREVEDGTLLIMRNGEELFTPEPFDKVDLKVTDTLEKFSVAVCTYMVQQSIQIESDDESDDDDDNT